MLCYTVGVYDRRLKLSKKLRALYDKHDLSSERTREFLFSWSDLVDAICDLIEKPAFSR